MGSLVAIEGLWKRAREARVLAGLDLATAARAIGLQQNQLRNIENGTSTPSTKTTAEMAECYSVTMDWLALGGELRSKEPWKPLEFSLVTTGGVEQAMRGESIYRVFQRKTGWYFVIIHGNRYLLVGRRPSRLACLKVLQELDRWRS